MEARILLFGRKRRRHFLCLLCLATPWQSDSSHVWKVLLRMKDAVVDQTQKSSPFWTGSVDQRRKRFGDVRGHQSKAPGRKLNTTLPSITVTRASTLLFMLIHATALASRRKEPKPKTSKGA